MSVPFKYKQHFRDLFASFGGKPLTSSDIECIAQRLPPPKFSSAIIEKYSALVPLDEAGLLSMIAEGQKDCGLPYDDIAWGLVEGFARYNFFGGGEGGDCSCDTKELRLVLDPKIRPVRLDVNNLFATHTSGGDRTTMGELMKVLRNVYPSNQTNFAELYGWAKATKSTRKAPPPPKTDVLSTSQTGEAPAVSSTAGATSSGSEQNVAASPSVATTAHAQEVAALPSAANVEVHSDVPRDSGAATAEGGDETKLTRGFSQIRERFGSVAKAAPPPPPVPTKSSSATSAADDAQTASPKSLAGGADVGGGESPPGSPPPPPPADDDSSPLGNNSIAQQPAVKSEEENPFAAYVLEASAAAGLSVADVPFVVVTPPAAQEKKHQAPPDADDSAAISAVNDSRSGKQRLAVGGGGDAAPAQPAATPTFHEPPPLPANVKAAMERVQQQQSHRGGATHQSQWGGGQEASQQQQQQREALSLRQIQQLPPEVIDFIQQLDQQRSHLQVQLQRELDDLTENNQVLRLVKERLASLRELQQTPVFMPLEAERQDLIHKMEQWIFATRAGKEATRTELHALRQAQLADRAAQAVYKDSMLFAPPATTVFGTQHKSSSATHTAAAALAAFTDPTPRLAKFFENLSNKEREVKQQESVLDRIRQLEKRERKILNEMMTPSASGGSPAKIGMGSSQAVESTGVREWAPPAAAAEFAPQHALQHHPAAGPAHQAPSGSGAAPGTSRVFRMDPTVLSQSSTQQRGVSGVAPTGGSSLFFSPSSGSKNPRVATAHGFTAANPFLTRNIAEQHRTSTEASAHVTRRLEEQLKGSRSGR